MGRPLTIFSWTDKTNLLSPSSLSAAVLAHLRFPITTFFLIFFILFFSYAIFIITVTAQVTLIVVEKVLLKIPQLKEKNFFLRGWWFIYFYFYFLFFIFKFLRLTGRSHRNKLINSPYKHPHKTLRIHHLLLLLVYIFFFFSCNWAKGVLCWGSQACWEARAMARLLP